MRYYTPTTHDFTEKSETWKLEPKENQIYELQAVQMIFDANIDHKDDVVIRFYNYNQEEPIVEKRYTSFLDWILKSTEQEKVEGVLSIPIHKFYINFSEDVKLTHKGLDPQGLHYMTVEVDGNNLLQGSNGETCMIGKGEYIINVVDV